jgi:hypothetical protein
MNSLSEKRGHTATRVHMAAKISVLLLCISPLALDAHYTPHRKERERERVASASRQVPIVYGHSKRQIDSTW